jgi:hypothetical protein
MPRRRPSIEERTRRNAYHMLLDSGQLPSDDEVIDDVDTDVRGHIQSELLEEESPNTPQSQLAPPILDASVETSKPLMVSVLCGRQDPKSWYLTRRLARMPSYNADAPSDSVTLLKNRNIDPDASELHRLWRRTGVIPTRYRDINFEQDGINSEHTWITCWPLINAAIYGYKLKDVEFVDRVMDLLEDKVVKGVRPDFDTISHIFGEKQQHMPMALGSFLVDRWVDCVIPGFGDMDPYSLPQLFVYAALETAMQRLSYGKRSSSPPGCQYHTHAKHEECSKHRHLPEEAKRQERYRYRREKVSREAGNVVADSIECSISTVDWEERRLEDHRRLRDEVDGSSRAINSQLGTSKQDMETNHTRRLDPLKGAPTQDREVESTSHVKSLSLSSSVVGTAQVEGAVDEVKFAPPDREPPPPSPPSTPVIQYDSIVKSDQRFAASPKSREFAPSLISNVMPFIKSVEGLESTDWNSPAIPPEPDTKARTTSKESLRQKKHATYPGPFRSLGQET